MMALGPNHSRLTGPQGEHTRTNRATQGTGRLRGHRTKGLPGSNWAPGQTGQERSTGLVADDGPPGQPGSKRNQRFTGPHAQPAKTGFPHHPQTKGR